jgi:sugar phosphate isomerase/epimerase
MDRREFLAGVAASAAAPAPGAGKAVAPGPLCFFSKHLPGLTPREMARRLLAAGYGGIELTVRAGGHVLPERVQSDLPRAIDAIRAEGLEVPIIATALTSADDKFAAPILDTAAKHGVRIFRPGWFTYALKDVRQELRQAGQALAPLAALAGRAGIELAYQNHAGNLGAAVWDLDRLIEPLDRRWAGVYFDIRHAVAEGGAGGWKPAIQLVASRVKVFSVKDFYWERAATGAWAVTDCPLGQGMVDVRTPLQMLARQGFRGPVTVFLEYEPPANPDKVLAAAARDLAYLRARIAEAYG